MESKDINAWIQAHVSPAQRVAFVTALISGLMAHFILLSHGMMSQDGLTQSIMYHANDFETAIGRWGIQIFEKLRFGMAVSYLSGIICIFVVAFATMIILRIFEIESRWHLLWLLPCSMNIRPIFTCIVFSLR